MRKLTRLKRLIKVVTVLKFGVVEGISVTAGKISS